jgi:hypothetical protein
MTAKTLAAAAFAVLAITGCGGASSSRTTSGAEDAAALAWAECLRSHGIPNFPDPIAGHKAQFPDSAGPSLGSNAPSVLSAEQSCKGLHAAIVGASSSESGSRTNQDAAFLEFARCMRAHGVPNYPDPNYGKNGRPISPNLASHGIDPRSPAFTNAARACNGHGIPLGGDVAER